MWEKVRQDRTDDRHCVQRCVRWVPLWLLSPTYKDLYEVWKEVKRVLDPVTKRKDEQVKQIELITGGKVENEKLVDRVTKGEIEVNADIYNLDIKPKNVI